MSNKLFSAALLSAFLSFAAGCGEQTGQGAPVAPTQAAQSRAPGTILLDIQTQDGKMPTVVGKVVEGKGLESTGKEGFLMFGPYLAMASGDYKLVVYGEFSGDQPAKPLVIDVAYDKSASIAKSVDVQAADSKDGILAGFDFHLPTQVSDLEVRARVANGTHVVVKGYRVVVK